MSTVLDISVLSAFILFHIHSNSLLSHLRCHAFSNINTFGQSQLPIIALILGIYSQCDIMEGDIRRIRVHS